MKIVVLDDYQRVARTLGPFDSLADAEVAVLHEHIADPDELADALRGAEVVVAMRERTPFPAAMFDRLPDLRLLVTTGMANAAVDMAAAAPHGVTVTAPNTVLLPHLGYVTEGGYRSMYEQVVEDITAWRAGTPVRVLAG